MNINYLVVKVEKLTDHFIVNRSPFFLFKGVLVLLMVLFTSACNEKAKRSPIKGLGDSSVVFEKPDPDNIIRFPQAHAPHKSFQQEWWYLTANLTTENGQSLATQWTLFRRGVESKHWYFGHAALADTVQHQSAFRSAREELGNLTISTAPFNARIDDWQWQSTQELLPANLQYGNIVSARVSENMTDAVKQDVKRSLTIGVPSAASKQLSTYPSKQSSANQSVTAKTQQWQVNLNLRLDEHLSTNKTELYFLQGKNGFSKKHRLLDIASHYYSQPFINVTGEVYWQNKWQKVTGKAWFDREWGSQMLADDQQGWDWFSLRLNKETALMVYRIRSNETDYIYGSIMNIDGSMRTLSEKEIVLKNISTQHLTTNFAYPDLFSIHIASENINIKVNVINKKQIMHFGIEYFEGMVSFSGSHQGQGFLEMTGYDD